MKQLGVWIKEEGGAILHTKSMQIYVGFHLDYPSFVVSCYQLGFSPTRLKSTTQEQAQQEALRKIKEHCQKALEELADIV